MNGSTITRISQPTLAQALRSWLWRMLKMTQTISIQMNSSSMVKYRFHNG